LKVDGTFAKHAAGKRAWTRQVRDCAKPRLAGDKISGPPPGIALRPIFVCAIIFFYNKFSLPLLLLAPLGLIAPVFNTVAVLDIVGYFLRKPCGGPLNLSPARHGNRTDGSFPAYDACMSPLPQPMLRH
jgi:hypothetical protein